MLVPHKSPNPFNANVKVTSLLREHFALQLRQYRCGNSAFDIPTTFDPGLPIIFENTESCGGRRLVEDFVDSVFQL